MRKPPILLAALVIYAPYVCAAVATWLFLDCDHCKRTWLEMLWVFPGMMLVSLASVAVTGSPHVLPNGLDLIAAGLATLAEIVAVAWLIERGAKARAIVVPSALALSAVGAWAMYHIMQM